MPFIPPIPGVGDVGALTSDDVWSLRVAAEAARRDGRRADRLRAGAELSAARQQRDAHRHGRSRIAEGGRGRLGAGCRRASRRGHRRADLAQGRALRGRRAETADRRATRARRWRFRSTKCSLRSDVAPIRSRWGLRSWASRSIATARSWSTNICAPACRTSSRAAMWRVRISSRTWRRIRRGMRRSTRCSDAFRKFKVNYAVVPWATYTDPEVARVGLSVDEAHARGIDVEVTRHRTGARRPRDRRWRDARLHQSADATRIRSRARRNHRRAAGRRADRRVRARDDARPRAEEADGHDPHLSDERGDQQIRGERVGDATTRRTGCCASREYYHRLWR